MTFTRQQVLVVSISTAVLVTLAFLLGVLFGSYYTAVQYETETPAEVWTP